LEEIGSPQNGVFPDSLGLGSLQNGVVPDSRRLALRIKRDRIMGRKREFQLVSTGRAGVMWRSEMCLLEVVVRVYDLENEERESLRQASDFEG
jgi:hypothetical protein